MDHRGKPYKAFFHVDDDPLMTTRCVLSVRNALIHPKMLP